MSKENYTHIIAIIDRSGSMGNIHKDMEKGFDHFIKEQKEVAGEATLTLIKFDNHYDIVHSNLSITDVPSFTLEPRGMTALLDAMGKTMSTERDRINNMDNDDQPEKVICIIITDGMENASIEFERSRIFTMITDLEKTESPKWNFVFLGANQDAIAEGGGLGIDRSKSITYSATSDGTKHAFQSLSTNTRSYRSVMSADYSFLDDDRKQQDKLLDQKDEIDSAIPSSDHSNLVNSISVVEDKEEK